MSLINEDFILQNEYAKTLFHKYAKDMPIFDFHCHLEAKEIYENKNFDSITQVWLGGDHYKWRVMRACGISEEYITGDKSDKEKFDKWAYVVPKLLGNPLYHWTALELNNFFGIKEELNPETADEIYEKTNELLQTDKFKPRSLIERSNVKAVCTTNDPVDDLKYHKLLKEEDFKVIIKPAFRPDKALNIEKEDFKDYIKELQDASDTEIKSFKDIKTASEKRINYFEENGCSASDHALKYFPYIKKGEEEIDGIVRKAINGEEITKIEEEAYKTALLTFLAKEYKKRDWAMEIHVAAIRDNSKALFKKLGPDVGNDAVNDELRAENLANLMSDFESCDGLPKMLLFSLNENDYYPLATIGGSFNRENETGLSNIQIGTSWWFADHLDGMQKQMTMFAQTGVFANFVGMLTDSRSFLSYPRHEYFRRILCNFIGEKVAKGQYPWKEEYLGQMVKDISFNNAEKYIRID